LSSLAARRFAGRVAAPELVRNADLRPLHRLPVAVDDAPRQRGRRIECDVDHQRRLARRQLERVHDGRVVGVRGGQPAGAARGDDAES